MKKEVKGIDEIPVFSWNTRTKEFYVLGHKFDGVNSIEDFINFINDLQQENTQLKEQLENKYSALTYYKNLRKELGIDEYLELIKEDKNLNSAYTSFAQYMHILEQENKQLKDEVKVLDNLVELKRKRKLIARFDKEFDEEDKKKNPNREYTRVEPDAEEVYKRYYELKKTE